MTATMAMTSETPGARVLVVDDKESVLELMSRILGEAYDVTTTADPRRAMDLLERRCFDVVLTDIRMPQATGFDLLAAAKRCAHEPRVVMITGFASVPDAVVAMREGAFDYLAKPLEAEEISLVVARAVEAVAAPRAEDANGTMRVAGANGHGRTDDGGRVETVFHDAVAAARDRASHDYLVALMRQFHGNVTHAATRAGMTRESLHRLLKKYGVRSEAFKMAARG